MKKEKEEYNFEIEMGSNINLDDGLPSPYQYDKFHRYKEDWAIDESILTKDIPIEKKAFFKKIIDKISMGYWDFLLILWRIKHKITKK